MKLKYVTDELKLLNDRRAAISNLKEQIQTLEYEFKAIKATRYDKDIVSGSSGTSKEAKMIENIAQREQLRQDLAITLKQVIAIEKTLNELSDSERLVLTRMYINHERGAVPRLMNELNCEQAQVYRLKDKALLHFGTRKYGQIQL